MWLDDTVSPATSTSGTTRVSNSSCERRKSAVPCAPLPKRKFSPTETLRRAQPVDQDLAHELLGGLLGEAPVERDHHHLGDAQRGDQVALDGERGDQLGRGLGVDHGQRVRVEGQHRVGAADHLAVAEMDAVEGADGDLARPGAGRDVGELA